MKFNIIGNFLGTSGYDVHTRQLFNALSKIADVKLTTGIQPGQEKLLTDKELEAIKKQDDEDRIRIIITYPLQWRLHLEGKRNWVFCVWEGDRVPRHFLDEMLNENIEKILTPSQHTKQAILNTWKDYYKELINKDEAWELEKDIIEKKLRIIPHGQNPDIFYKKETPKEVFTYLLSKGWRNNEDRGGTMYAVQAYLEEFTSKDVTSLIIKINPAYGIPNVQELINEIKPKDKTDFAPLQINIDNIPYNKLVELYNMADVFLMPTRAESFGIPGIESMACGVPIITTNFGGQVDYANEENSWIIGGELTEIVHEIQYENVKWLSPSIPELRKAMREAYENRELVKEKGIKSLETAKQFTWDNTAKKLMELI